MNPPRTDFGAYTLLTLAMLFWAGNWIAGRIVADDIPPVALTLWRWLIALALLAAFVLPELWAKRRLVLARWKFFLAIGFLGGGVHNVLQYWGLQFTTATNGTILNSLTPVLIFALGALLLGDPLPRRAMLGGAVSLAGALAIVTRLDADVLAALDFNTGDLLIILSLVIFAGYTLMLRWKPEGLSPLAFLACFAIAGMVPVLGFYALELSAGHRMQLNPTSVAGLLYVAIGPALLAYHFWNLGVTVVGPARAGVFVHLMPVFGSLMGVAFLGEAFESHHAIGMALIFAGIGIATRGRR